MSSAEETIEGFASQAQNAMEAFAETTAALVDNFATQSGTILTQFGAALRGDALDLPGVYLLTYCGEICYVGMSRRVRMRIEAHRRNGRPFDKAFSIRCTAAEAVILERMLIRALSPKGNRVMHALRNRGEEDGFTVPTSRDQSSIEATQIIPHVAAAAKTVGLDGAREARPFGVEPHSVSVAAACALTGIGRSKMFEYIRAGRIETSLVDKRRLVIYASLKAFINQNIRAASMMHAPAGDDEGALECTDADSFAHSAPPPGFGEALANAAARMPD